ncbi:MEDS domain-containing protein [Mesobacillus campisalis]|uniref:MEDS domain-containing protein n=1 Tax=Mesobacillus campisalis TaxID=1408103 RepID=UPI00069B7608|nr:MEDS domain-containing protein [Mesobacillus campisalis]
MQNGLRQLLSHFNDKEAHIFYHFNDNDLYLNNVMTFISIGIKKGYHILVIENERNIIHINSRLMKEFSEEECSKVHIINNFDFYYANNSFDPKVIYDHFIKSIAPFLDDHSMVWTWGLVEWGEESEIIPKIKEYEQNLDKFIKGKDIISVCAYDVQRTPEQLKDILMTCHCAMLTDDRIFLPQSKS